MENRRLDGTKKIYTTPNQNAAQIKKNSCWNGMEWNGMAKRVNGIELVLDGERFLLTSSQMLQHEP